MDALFDARPIDPQRFRPATHGWTQRLICGVINVFSGEEGVGKGTLEVKTMADFTRGRLPGVFEGKPVRVLWLGDEDSCEQVVGPRLHAAGADFAYVSEVTGDRLLNVVTDAQALDCLLLSGPFAVVVFEQLLDNLPLLRKPNDPQEVRAALQPLRRILRRREAIGLATLHVNKGHAPDFRSALSGSHQFNALSRSSLLVANHPDGSDRRVLIGGKANYSASAVPLSFEIQIREFDLNGHHFEEPLACEFREEPRLTMEAVLRGPGAGRREEEQRAAEQRLLDVLTDSPGATAMDVARALGIAYRTAMDRLTEAHEAGGVRREGEGKKGDPPVGLLRRQREPIAPHQ